MKQLFSILFSVVISLTAIAQVQTIALLEPRAGEGSEALTPMEKAMVRGELRKAIVNMPGYQAITRADIDQMMKEQDFQRTGMVSDEQIKQMGEMSGADYICVSTLTKSDTEFYIEAYLIHLESGRMSNPASQYGELANGKFANMLPVCEKLAKELLGDTKERVPQQVPSSPQITQSQAQQNQPKVNSQTDSQNDQKKLWLDKNYSAECRKKGEKVFNQLLDLYKELYNEARSNGTPKKKAEEQAIWAATTILAEKANNVVLECSEGK